MYKCCADVKQPFTSINTMTPNHYLGLEKSLRKLMESATLVKRAHQISLVHVFTGAHHPKPRSGTAHTRQTSYSCQPVQQSAPVGSSSLCLQVQATCRFNSDNKLVINLTIVQWIQSTIYAGIINDSYLPEKRMSFYLSLASGYCHVYTTPILTTVSHTQYCIHKSWCKNTCMLALFMPHFMSHLHNAQLMQLLLELPVPPVLLHAQVPAHARICASTTCDDYDRLYSKDRCKKKHTTFEEILSAIRIRLAT